MTFVRSDLLDCEDLASRVCELVSRPAWPAERRRQHNRRREVREVREGDDSSSSSSLGRVCTVSSLDSSVYDGSVDPSSVCDDAHCLEDQVAPSSPRGRTNMLMSDCADYISYADTTRSSVGELAGDASITKRPNTRRRRTSDIESCGEKGDEPSLDFEDARLAGSDFLTPVDGARRSRHESNGCLGDRGVLGVLFGIFLGILMSVSFEESMRLPESSARQQNESLPGRVGRRTLMSPPWSLSITNLLSRTMQTRDRAREKYDPRWYHFQGAYSDSFTFCSKNESRIPCPYSVYCPGGRGSAPEMRYEGDRPHNTNGGSPKHVPIIDLPFGWARLGVPGEDGNISEDTCSVQIETEIVESVEVSSHILCCREAPLPVGNEVESNFLHGDLDPRKSVESDNDREEDRDDLLRQRLDPAWFDPQHGWFGELEGAYVLFYSFSVSDFPFSSGGTHEEAASFCEDLATKRRLCPYVAYCPQGQGHPVHDNSEVFDQGEFWSPILSHSNESVMIGRKYGNSATTCMTSSELDGIDNNRSIFSQYVMCCR